MKYKVSIVDKKGPNVVEYDSISDTIFTISQRRLGRDDMRKIEEFVGLDSTLGVVNVRYQQIFPTGKYIMIWSVTRFADCDWE